eukprot:Rmarinus@m.27809
MASCWPEELFVSPVSEFFKCTICYEAARDAVMCKNCQKPFGTGCLRRALSSAGPGVRKCPYCREPIPLKDVPHRIVRGVLGESKVSCGQPGCDSIVPLDDLLTHRVAKHDGKDLDLADCVTLLRENKDDPAVATIASAKIREASEQNDKRSSLVQMGVLNSLLAVLHHRVEDAKRNAEVAIRNLASVYDLAAELAAYDMETFVRILSFASDDDISRNVLTVILNFPTDEEKINFVKHGGVPDILKFLEPGNDEELTLKAVTALLTLSCVSENVTPLVSAGVLHRLRPLLQSENLDFLRPVAALLWRVSSNGSHEKEILESGVLPDFRALLHTSNMFIQLYATGVLWRLSCEERNQDAIVSAGVVPDLVSLLNEDLEDVVMDIVIGTLWSLSLHREHRLHLGGAGAVEVLTDFLRGNRSDFVAQRTAATLWRLAACEELFDSMIRAQTIPLLLDTLPGLSNQMLEDAIDAIGALAKHAQARELLGRNVSALENVLSRRGLGVSSLASLTNSVRDLQDCSTAASSTPPVPVSPQAALHSGTSGRRRTRAQIRSSETSTPDLPGTVEVQGSAGVSAGSSSSRPSREISRPREARGTAPAGASRSTRTRSVASLRVPPNSAPCRDGSPPPPMLRRSKRVRKD